MQQKEFKVLIHLCIWFAKCVLDCRGTNYKDEIAQYFENKQIAKGC